MPVLQSQDFIDFSNATLDEKIDLVYELLDKQRELAQLTLENGIFSSEVEMLLKFIIVICNTNFAVMLLRSIENKVYAAPKFLFPYSRKPDEDIEENMEIDFLVH